MTRTRAVAIIINKDQVLLMHRFKDGKEYWVFPGGGVEDGESTEHAVLREVLEETSLSVKVDKLLYQHYYDKDVNDGHYFLCTYLSGEPKLGDSVEMAKMLKNPSQLWEPRWIKLAELPNMLVYPLEIRDLLFEDYKKGFSDSYPKVFHHKISELRQSL